MYFKNIIFFFDEIDSNLYNTKGILCIAHNTYFYIDKSYESNVAKTNLKFEHYFIQFTRETCISMAPLLSDKSKSNHGFV